VTSERVEASAREVRRILVVALLAVLVAAPVAAVLVLRSGDSEGQSAAARTRLFPASFRETGFVAEPVSLLDAVDTAGTRTELRHEFAGADTAWVVARCDTGSITVQTGAVSSSRECTGEPVGLAVFRGTRLTDRPLDVVATVSNPQRSSWGVAVYR
jgi:hypothetical protein